MLVLLEWVVIQALKVIGIGSIKVRIFDGVVRTLSNIKHVSKLRRGLGPVCLMFSVLENKKHQKLVWLRE